MRLTDKIKYLPSVAPTIFPHECSTIERVQNSFCIGWIVRSGRIARGAQLLLLEFYCSLDLGPTVCMSCQTFNPSLVHLCHNAPFFTILSKLLSFHAAPAHWLFIVVVVTAARAACDFDSSVQIRADTRWLPSKCGLLLAPHTKCALFCEQNARNQLLCSLRKRLRQGVQL